MSVLLLKPCCKDYLWGGEKLRTRYNIESDKKPLAEGWMLSCHPDGESVITNTSDKGMTLSKYIKKYGKGVCGKNCEAFDDFPLLIKFIDAKGNLSIQVHPSDEYAQKHENQFGKTEMWYILENEPDAFLYYGFQKEVSREEFKKRIENNTLTDVLNAVKVKKGDMFFIPSGTIHAIGKGIVIAEIQQNSNVTYRVYDYGRKDQNGNMRELHIDKALDVTCCKPPKSDFNFGSHLAKTKYFTTDFAKNTTLGDCDNSSFTSILITDGTAVLNCEDNQYRIKRGDSVFLTAGSGKWTLDGNFEALITRV